MTTDDVSSYVDEVAEGPLVAAELGEQHIAHAALGQATNEDVATASKDVRHARVLRDEWTRRDVSTRSARSTAATTSLAMSSATSMPLLLQECRDGFPELGRAVRPVVARVWNLDPALGAGWWRIQ